MSVSVPVEDGITEVVQRRPNPPQAKFLQRQAPPDGPAEYFLLEGATGSGKTTAPAWKLLLYATRYPGIHVGLWAWTEDLLGPALEAFHKAAREDGFSVEDDTLRWHGKAGEEYYEFVGYGSRVYVRSMRASEDSMRTQKLSGLNLSIIWIDQPDAIDQDNEDVYRAYIPARLRQPGFPHEVWLSPNPLSEGHWLSMEFPTDEKKAKPNHHYIHFALRHNVGYGVNRQYLLDMEAAHPPGSPTRARYVEGTRAPLLRGKPIYGPMRFKREKDGHPWHTRSGVPRLDDQPVYDAWDFGTLHPAWVCLQMPWWGQLRILGAIEGDDIALEHFIPLVKETREEWFGKNVAYQTTCDPAGTARSGHGSLLNGKKILNDHGIYPVTSFALNSIEGISYAIQSVMGFMAREVIQPLWKRCGPECDYCERYHAAGRKGDRLPFELVVRGGKILHGVKVPAFVVDERRHLKFSNADVVEWPVLIRGFESGYVHDKRIPHGASNIQRPLKDNEHDHTQRCVEYAVQQFWKPRPAEEQLEQDIARQYKDHVRQQRAELREALKPDHDPDDPPAFVPFSRGGYTGRRTILGGYFGRPRSLR